MRARTGPGCFSRLVCQMELAKLSEAKLGLARNLVFGVAMSHGLAGC